MEFIAANLIAIFAMAVVILSCTIPFLWNRFRTKDK